MSKFGDALDYIGGKKKEEETVENTEQQQVEDTGEEAVIEEEVIENEVEAKTEEQEVHSNIENKTEEEEEQKPLFDREAFFKYASEMLGKDVKSEEDLVIEKEESELKYASEFSKGYDEYYKETKRSVEDYLSLNRDLSQLKKEDVVREILRRENPDLTNDEIDFEYEELYSIDEDLMDEREIKKKQIRLKKDYNSGLKELLQDQEKYKVPSETSEPSINEIIEKQQKQVEETQIAWRQAVEQTSKELTGFEVDLGDGFKFTHNISPEAKKQAVEIAKDNTMTKWAQRYSDKEGRLDTKKIQVDIYRRDNFEAILKDVEKQARAHEREVIAKEDKHIDFSSGKKPEPIDKVSKKAQDLIDLLPKYKR